MGEIIGREGQPQLKFSPLGNAHEVRFKPPSKLADKIAFRKELTALVNKYSLENGSGTPDHIISGYLLAQLNTFEEAVNSREGWYGRGQDPRFGTPESFVERPTK